MILIEPFHRAVRDVVLEQLMSFKNYQENPKDFSKPRDINVNIADFDGVLYTIIQAIDSPILTVSVFLSFYDEIKKFGESKVLQREYGKYLKSTSGGNKSVSLEFDCNQLPANIEEIAEKAASLRRNCFASVYEHFFDCLTTKPNDVRGVIHYRADETMFVQTLPDKVTVIFSTRFQDPGDIVLGKVFLQEFSEVKRRFDGAPQVLYCHRTAPQELSGMDTASGENIAYVTIVLEPRHISEKNKKKTIDLVHTFRTYMHYHIKCMKAYLQMRMRAKTSEFLKVLNRAHPGPESGPASFAINIASNE